MCHIPGWNILTGPLEDLSPIVPKFDTVSMKMYTFGDITLFSICVVDMSPEDKTQWQLSAL